MLQRSWHGYYYTTSLNIPGSEIPSWFPNQNSFSASKIDSELAETSSLSFMADIPDYCHSSEWSGGVAVCLVLQCDMVSAPSDDDNHFIYWNSKSPEDEIDDTNWSSYEIHNQHDWPNQIFMKL